MSSPEDRRVAELAQRVREDVATDAEREELALYEAESEQVQVLAVRAREESELGRGWLARYAGDRRLVALENSRVVRAERAVGVALVTGGFFATLVVPVVGVPLLIAGAAVLGWSVIRIAARTAGRDPYDEVEE
ncbi:MAG: hypothetical protein AAF447_13955 [Myxococcota bacterium]